MSHITHKKQLSRLALGLTMANGLTMTAFADVNASDINVAFTKKQENVNGSGEAEIVQKQLAWTKTWRI